jgi:hypothetical protein
MSKSCSKAVVVRLRNYSISFSSCWAVRQGVIGRRCGLESFLLWLSRLIFFRNGLKLVILAVVRCNQPWQWSNDDEQYQEWSSDGRWCWRNVG